jgi:hypothetical protein
MQSNTAASAMAKQKYLTCRVSLLPGKDLASQTAAHCVCPAKIALVGYVSPVSMGPKHGANIDIREVIHAGPQACIRTGEKLPGPVYGKKKAWARFWLTC